MTSAPSNRKYVRLGQLVMLALVAGFVADLFAAVQEHISRFTFYSVFVLLLAAYLASASFIRRKATAKYQQLPAVRQLEIDAQTRKLLARTALRIKIWLAWLPIGTILAFREARIDGLAIRIAAGTLAVLFFSYSVFWLKDVNRSLRLLDKKLAQPDGESGHAVPSS